MPISMLTSPKNKLTKRIGKLTNLFNIHTLSFIRLDNRFNHPANPIREGD